MLIKEKNKSTLAVLLFLITISSFSQTKDTLKNQPLKKSGVVSFITKLNIADAGKDGFYLNGYVVNIDYEKAKALNGKTIRIKGKARFVKGYKHQPGEDLRQAREDDCIYIDNPKIKVIKDKVEKI